MKVGQLLEALSFFDKESEVVLEIGHPSTSNETWVKLGPATCVTGSGSGSQVYITAWREESNEELIKATKAARVSSV